MSDYISRQAVLDAIFSEPLYKTGMKKRGAEEAVPAIFEKIKAFPSADVRENIPIKFIPINVDCRGYTETFRCSKCGCNITTYCVMKELDYDFCPWCGGKADE